MSKPNVLVLGGVGFIGRNFVKYLVDNNLAAKIRVVDKVLPSTAFLGDDHQAAFNNPIVEYQQGNLTSPGTTIFSCYLLFMALLFLSPLCGRCAYLCVVVNTILIFFIASIAKVFTLEGGKFNLVFNLAAETKYGQTDAVSTFLIFMLFLLPSCCGEK